MRKVKETFLIMGAIIGVPLIWWSWTSEAMNPPKPEMSQEDKWKSGARHACRDFISDHLHDPSSAQWGMSSGNWYASWPASADENGRVIVRPEFRANNAFGATVISRWECEVQADDNYWNLVRLDQH